MSSLCTLVALLAVVSIANSQTIADIRFADRSAKNLGVIEVTLTDGSVGRICDLGGFNNDGASAVCAMLGFREVTGYKVNLPAFTTGSTTSVIGVQSCNNFKLDSTNTWVLTTACATVSASSLPSACSNRINDVAVICTGSLTTAPPVTTTSQAPNLATFAPTTCSGSVTNLRLEPGPEEGLVVIRNGTAGATNFGSICALGFGINEATMICRMLCQNATTNAIALTGRNLVASATYPVMLSGLNCPPGATSTNQCVSNGWGSVAVGCNSTTAVTVRCTPISATPPAPPRPSVICRDNIATVHFPISDVPSSSLITLYGAYNTATCSFTKGENSTGVWASVPYVGCNGVQTFNDTHVIYTFDLYKNVTPVDGVYKDVPYLIPVICAIPKNSAVSAAVNPDLRTVTPITGGDTYTSEIRLFQSYSAGTFTTEILAGDKLIVGSKIYARILLTSPLDLQLIVTNCWAAHNKDGTGSRYNMVINKCATTDNAVFRVTAKSIGINFAVVSFTGQPSAQVYVFCDVKSCATSDTSPSCQQVCGTPVRKRRAAAIDLVPHIEEKPFRGPFKLVSATSLAARLSASAATAMASAVFAIATVGVLAWESLS